MVPFLKYHFKSKLKKKEKKKKLLYEQNYIS